MERRELIFKAMSWVFEDRETDMVIHVSGMTREGKTVQIQIEKFTPYCYLQLPKRITWTQQKCKTLFHHFVSKYKSKGPLNYSLKKKKNLYFLKEGNYMLLTFSTNDACRGFEKKCISKQYISGIGMINNMELLVHEHNIDPILKIASMKNILLSGWVKVIETIPEGEEELSEEDRKFSYADIDMYVHYKDISFFDMKEHVIITPLYCSFDIECYSVNHNSKLPDPKNHENEVFQIAMVFGKMGSAENQKTYLLTRFNPYDIEGCKTLRFKTEKALLLSFTELIKKLDPLFFIGYNIMKFDWDYMISRADKLGILDKFLELTRIIGKKANIDKINWSSSAYKEQEFRYPNCIGRTQLDVLIEVERNFKLPTYSLNVVAGKFLGEQKDDISPRQLFMFYKITKELLPVLEKEDVSMEKLGEIQKRIKEILPFRQTHGFVRRHRRHMLNCSSQAELTKLVRECLTMTLKYCRQDTILPIKIIEKLNLLTTMEEMSNVMHIPMSYLHTRGQQIKVLAQVFRETIHNGIIIPHHRKVKGAPKENYEGAIVAEAHAGDYRNVGTLDFASLYPTTMIAFNICYSTLITDPSVPDEKCHVLKWASHVGCEHDPKKRKKKDRDGKNIVICGDFRYRFLKVKLSYDEETKTILRENEGVMPRLERNLLASRSEVKKEMLKAEARLKMTRGEASEDDLAFYRFKKFEIIPKGYLSEEEEKKLDVYAGVLNAKQLAIKVSANSTSATTPIPCLVNDKLEYRYIEELFDEDNFEIDEDGNEVCKTPKINAKVWSDAGWSDIKYVFRHKLSSKDQLKRVLTHTGIVDVTKDHSLLDQNKKEVTVDDVVVGDQLFHMGVPLPIDTPNNPKHYIFDKLPNEKNRIDYISSEIINKEYSIRLSYFEKNILSKSGRVPIKNSLDSSILFYLLRSLGYAVTIISPEELEYSVSFDNKEKRNAIVSISSMASQKEEYVYDIETSSHHFAAGVGDLIVHNSAYGALGAGEGFIPLIAGAASVTAMGRDLITSAIKKMRDTWSNCKPIYGDTDSAMLVFENSTLKESFDLCKKASRVVTHHLKSRILGYDETLLVKTKSGKECTLDKIAPFSKDFEELEHPDKIKVLEYDSIPTDLSFECMYGRFLLLTKKRYIAYKVNEDGQVVDITKKGVVLSRRDNSPFLKVLYKYVSDGILNMKSEEEVMYTLYDEIHKLFTRRVPDTNLIIPVGVNKLIDYAKKKKFSIGEKEEVFYIDKNGEPIDEPNGPLDPRLVYPNLPQVLLSLKMIRRGTDVPPNTRLEQIFLEKGDALHQGDKAEDYTYYKENRAVEGLKIDFLHYIEKIQTPIMELLNVKYPRTIRVHYEKIEDAVKRVLNMKIKHTKQMKIAQTSSFAKEVPKYREYYVGWNAWENKELKTRWNRLPPVPSRVYLFKSMDAKVECVLSSQRDGGMDAFSMDDPVEAEIIQVCRKYKAKCILDRVCSQFKTKKRTPRKPTQTGAKVIKNTGVYIKMGEYAGKYGFVVELYLVSPEGSPEKKYEYDIQLEDYDEIAYRLPRESFTTYHLKDSRIMKDIYDARFHYKKVVEEFKDLVNPVILPDDF